MRYQKYQFISRGVLKEFLKESSKLQARNLSKYLSKFYFSTIYSCMQIKPSCKPRETIEYNDIQASMRISCRIAEGRQTEWLGMYMHTQN